MVRTSVRPSVGAPCDGMQERDEQETIKITNTAGTVAKPSRASGVRPVAQPTAVSGQTASSSFARLRLNMLRKAPPRAVG